MAPVDGGSTASYVPAVTTLRLAQVNLVLDDVAGAAAFLAGLGLAVDPVVPEWADWAAHHQSVSDANTTVDLDLDSTAFSRWWGGLRPDDGRVVVSVGVDERDAVDRVYATAIERGAESRREPHDAFWGARFALVAIPGPLLLGITSRRDGAFSGPTPELTDFA